MQILGTKKKPYELITEEEEELMLENTLLEMEVSTALHTASARCGRGLFRGF